MNHHSSNRRALRRALMVVACTLAVTPFTPATRDAAAQGPPGRPGQIARPPQPPLNRAQAARRDALEAQVLDRFLTRAATEMRIDATQKDQLGVIVRESAQRRRALNQRAMDLNRRLNVATRLADTPEATFARLLEDHEALRREETQIADREQAELRKILPPRQHAHFLTLWMRLQENARQIQAQRPIGPPR